MNNNNNNIKNGDVALARAGYDERPNGFMGPAVACCRVPQIYEVRSCLEIGFFTSLYDQLEIEIEIRTFL